MEGTRAPDSVKGLENLARNVIAELDGRFQTSFSKLNRQLAKCFDFAQLFAALCGTRADERVPVDMNNFSKFGAEEFRKCVQYVSEMPHIKDKNLELGSELASTVIWRAKKVLIEVIWGEMFASQFGKFFKKIVKKANGGSFIGIPCYSKRCGDDDFPREHRPSVFPV